jgi:hypothetical protein
MARGARPLEALLIACLGSSIWGGRETGGTAEAMAVRAGGWRRQQCSHAAWSVAHSSPGHISARTPSQPLAPSSEKGSTREIIVGEW